MAECEVQHTLQRSSSRTSSCSRHSQKTKTVRAKPQKRLSATSSIATDLTSFPSLSPDRSPEGFTGQPALNRALTNALLDGGDANSTGGGSNSSGGADSGSDSSRDRKSTLARLTSTLSQNSGRAALFDDAPPASDFPGALHLADDAHIERLISNTGAVKLVRQFARDLAQRDAEISTLRQRADARERELKRMLREVSVSNQDIERRLYTLDHSKRGDKDQTGGADGLEQAANPSAAVHGLMQQAMADDVGSLEEDPATMSTSQATIRGPRLEGDARSDTTSSASGTTRKRQTSLRNWQDYIFGGNANGRKSSRASSVMGDVGEAEEDSQRQQNPTVASARRKALDDQLFQPPEGRVSPGTEDAATSSTGNADSASLHSRKSSKSLSSWTVKLFAGNSQANKDDSASDATRSSGPSATRSKGKGDTSTAAANTRGSLSAVAALKRINSGTDMPNLQAAASRSANGSGSAGPKTGQVGRRLAATSVSQGTNPENTSKHQANLGPVEMDAILPLESRPPTLTPTYNNYQSGDLLTDRFGFIYDQRRKKRQREANKLRNGSHRFSVTETISSFRSDASDADEERQLGSSSSSVRSPGVATPDDQESSDSSQRRWQDYLRMPTGPAELLSHTPSVGPIVSLTTGDGEGKRGTAVAVDKRGSLAVNQNSEPSASTSTVTADRPEFSGTNNVDKPPAAVTPAANENEPVKLLLEQLSDLHDSLQRDKTVKWNEFLRKVRAERRKDGEAAAAAAAASDRPLQSVDMPEVSLADGEVVGIAGLGNKGKVGRAKWREFRSLVLGGIPVALRAKVWSECSGASSMRVPGYYDDLTKGIGGCEPDPSVVAQIDMDINRTLTDNVFFRKGPGVTKLKEVLLAYSRRNPEVGYCQGMNLIAASLLLITPTAEDTFWLLTSMIEVILPQHYYDHGLLASRADQMVLRQYISQVLPKLSAHLESLGVELEALTFQWFLSVFTDCLSAEALYRVWDVVLCLNVTSAVSPTSTGPNAASGPRESKDPSTSRAQDLASGSGGGSTFLFQVALALLKLNEQQLLTTCSTSAELYTYINHQMTNHAISIDGLIQASEALRNVVHREDVVSRRADAMREFGVPLDGS